MWEGSEMWGGGGRCGREGEMWEGGGWMKGEMR